MNTSDAQPPPEGADVTAAMFASLVMQNANMALIFLGKAPNPQTGQTSQDLENARYFIDQLEMLEVKTKGNLSKPEAALLNQSLTSLRLAFVEAVEHPAAGAESGTSGGPPTDEQETPVTEPAKPDLAASAQPAPAPESQKKFSKKY
ncbi:MAG: DUF1844 domain-containing protein [Limisphaerales bacterium]